MKRQPAGGKFSICNDSSESPQLSIYQEVQPCFMGFNRVARRDEPLEPIDPFSRANLETCILLRLSQNLSNNDTNKGLSVDSISSTQLPNNKISNLLPFKAGSNYKR